MKSAYKFIITLRHGFFLNGLYHQNPKKRGKTKKKHQNPTKGVLFKKCRDLNKFRIPFGPTPKYHHHSFIYDICKWKKSKEIRFRTRDLSLSLYVCVSLSLSLCVCMSLSLSMCVCVSLSLYVCVCVSLSLSISWVMDRYR